MSEKRESWTRRGVLRGSALALSLAALFQPQTVIARTYLSAGEARRLIWGNKSFTRRIVPLSDAQRRTIRRSSGVRVRGSSVNAYKSSGGDWFILDRVLGKHEFIDIAVGITRAGTIKGIEILEYRETYGHEVRNGNWRAQFYGRGSDARLRLGRQIRNISGATLSCSHITDGINRLTHTWSLVLRNS